MRIVRDIDIWLLRIGAGFAVLMFDGAFRTYERLVVPVSTDGESVDGFVGVWNWVD